MMVTIVVRAYMREQMIRKTLDSLMAQKTTYTYEVIVGENHGTDKTLAICREYEAKYDNIKVLAHDQNVGPLINWVRCIQYGTGKYIMTCDGDDWWHNTNKIQMEVDYMEAHPECVILHTDYDIYDEKTGEILHDVRRGSGNIPKEGSIQEELFHWTTSIAYLTSCYRRSLLEKFVPIQKFVDLKIVGEDYLLWVIMSAHGEVRYIPISTATYRIGNISVTREVNYERIIYRREGDKNALRLLYAMFPNLGTYHEDEYFDNFYSHQLLLAAYRGDDYKSARKFAREDKMPNWKTRMAYTWITFKLCRLMQ